MDSECNGLNEKSANMTTMVEVIETGTNCRKRMHRAKPDCHELMDHPLRRPRILLRRSLHDPLYAICMLRHLFSNVRELALSHPLLRYRQEGIEDVPV